MNKALITKFLSNIDNNDLPIFGAIVIKSNPTSSLGTGVGIDNTEEFSVSELGGSDVLFNNKVVTSIPNQKGGIIVVDKDGDKVKYIVLKDIKYKPVLTGAFKLFGSAICDMSYLKYQSNITAIIKVDESLFTGSLSDLPSGVTNLTVGNSPITGNIKDLPSGITNLDLNNNSSITGNIKDLPSGITSLNLRNDSSITGNIKDLPSGITSLNLANDSSITGDIKDLPSGITSLNLENDSSITGNIKDLPSGVTNLAVGNTSITGNIKDLPSGITSLLLGRATSITGTLESYVEKLYNAHKNDDKDFTLSAHTELTRVTFNGALAHYLSTTTISGGKATVIAGSKQGGTYDGTSWTYNS